MRKTTVIGFSALLVVAIGLIALLATRVNDTYKYAITRKGMTQAAELLRSYHVEHGQWPAAPFDYLAKNGVSVDDQWLRKLDITVWPKRVRIVSYASDGMVGGDGLAADIVVEWDVGEAIIRGTGIDVKV